MSAAQSNGSASLFDQNRAFTDANVGGPIIKDKAYFYGSYYRPTVNRDNSATAYGPVPNLEDTRNEGFAKVTLTPTHNTLFNVSYRDSHELVQGVRRLLRLRGGHGRQRRRGVAADRQCRRLLDHQQQQPRDVQVHALLEPDAGRPGQRLERHDQHRDRYPSADRQPRLAGVLHGPQADPRQRRAERLRAADHQSVRLPLGRRPAGGRQRRLRVPPDGPGQLRPELRPDRLQRDARQWQHAPQRARRVSAVRGLGGSEAHVERLGIDQRAGRDDQVRDRPRSNLLPGDLSGSRARGWCRRFTRNTTRAASR